MTGGSGFIGTNFVDSLTGEGVDVANIDVTEPRDPTARSHHSFIDIRDETRFREVFERFAPTHVLHLAARTDLGGSALHDYDANTLGVRNLLTILARTEAPVERVLIASSRMVCRIGYQPSGDEDWCPSTPYGVSKVETERMVRTAQIEQPWSILRPTSIWGPWFDVPYRDFFLSVARRQYVHPQGRSIYKSFGFVLNTVDQIRGLLTAPERETWGRTFYVADNPPIEVRDLADRISAALDQRRVTSLPVPLMRCLGRAGDVIERVGGTAPLTSFRLNNLLTPMTYDLTPLEQLTGKPRYGLEASIPMTTEWMRSQKLV